MASCRSRRRRPRPIPGPRRRPRRRALRLDDVRVDARRSHPRPPSTRLAGATAASPPPPRPAAGRSGGEPGTAARPLDRLERSRKRECVRAVGRSSRARAPGGRRGDRREPVSAASCSSSRTRPRRRSRRGGSDAASPPPFCRYHFGRRTSGACGDMRPARNASRNAERQPDPQAPRDA